MDATSVEAVIFDLDNTLLDREALFLRVAEAFYDEYLAARHSVTRDEAVELMVRWDEDGYGVRQAMRRRWLSEWPDTGLDEESLATWYGSAMDRLVEPDAEVNAFLTQLNEQSMPWGIVTNGDTSRQRGKCRGGGPRSARAVHHRLRRGGLRETRPEDIPAMRSERRDSRLRNEPCL